MLFAQSVALSVYMLINAKGVILAHTDFWGIQNVCQQWGVKMYYVYLYYCKQGDKL
jgi:hypothetical protein